MLFLVLHWAVCYLPAGNKWSGYVDCVPKLGESFITNYKTFLVEVVSVNDDYQISDSVLFV